MSARISRTQAWCKLAVLIADGAPAPLLVSFHEDSPILAMTVQTESDVAAWVAHFEQGDIRPRHMARGEQQWICAGFGHWHGWDVQLAAYPPVAAEPEPTAEDLRWVRHIAAHGEMEQPDEIAGAVSE